ncbi:MAG: DNA recombination protein RmuC [Anaeromyxobacteraceae bacterium]
MDSGWVVAAAVVFFGIGLGVGLALRRRDEGADARAQERVRAEVELLAGRLLDEKGRAMLDRSHERLRFLLDPVAERLKAFEAKVEKVYGDDRTDRAALREQLRLLQETQTRLHEDAEHLARALTGDSKAQGDWGELILERILETAGLTEGREYDLQLSRTDDEGGRKRPDAVVYLPANRAVIVDAKCSLTAFVEAMNAPGGEEREEALDRHLGSVRKHVKELAAKDYQDVLRQRTLDIVLLFVPNEPAFHAALSREPGLYEEAFRQGVVLCSPTTLLAALRLIAHVWRSEKQNVNAQRIAEEAGKLLGKLGAFVDDLDQVGARLDQAKDAFQNARSKLSTGRGNVMRKAAEIQRLGARVKPGKAESLLSEGADGVEDEDGPAA